MSGQQRHLNEETLAQEKDIGLQETILNSWEEQQRETEHYQFAASLLVCASLQSATPGHRVGKRMYHDDCCLHQAKEALSLPSP